MRNDGEGFDLDAILAAINDNTRLVFLANPNNPTGTLIDAAAVDEFLAKVPDHVVVVLDEAYYEFALYFAKLRQFEYSRSLEHLRRGAAWSFCEHSPKRMDWQACASDTVWARPNFWHTARACATLSQFLPWPRQRLWPRSTTTITSHESSPTMRLKLKF